MEDLQNDAIEIGRTILVATSYIGSDFSNEEIKELKDIGRALHLVETERLYMDGGQSMQRILDQISSLNDRLQTVLQDRGSELYARVPRLLCGAACKFTYEPDVLEPKSVSGASKRTAGLGDGLPKRGRGLWCC